MALTTAGIKFLVQAAVGQGRFFNAANAMLGVGNGTTAFNEAQTDLQGTSTLRKAMDEGYPVVQDNEITFKSTFDLGDANFPWHEWGVFNSATGGVMLNRVLESNGAKQSNQTWVFEVTISFSAG